MTRGKNLWFTHRKTVGSWGFEIPVPKEKIVDAEMGFREAVRLFKVALETLDGFFWPEITDTIFRLNTPREKSLVHQLVVKNKLKEDIISRIEGRWSLLNKKSGYIDVLHAKSTKLIDLASVEDRRLSSISVDGGLSVQIFREDYMLTDKDPISIILRQNMNQYIVGDTGGDTGPALSLRFDMPDQIVNKDHIYMAVSTHATIWWKKLFDGADNSTLGQLNGKRLFEALRKLESNLNGKIVNWGSEFVEDRMYEYGFKQ